MTTKPQALCFYDWGRCDSRLVQSGIHLIDPASKGSQNISRRSLPGAAMPYASADTPPRILDELIEPRLVAFRPPKSYLDRQS